MRRPLLVLLGIVFVLAPASPALARGDGWSPLPAGDIEGQFWGSGTDILIHSDVIKEYGRVITRKGHQILQVTGALKSTVTNMDTGKSIHVNVSGPGRIYLDEPRVEGTGNWLIFLFPGQPGDTGVPTLFTTSGHFTFTFDQKGVFQTYLLHGHMTPLCPLIS